LAEADLASGRVRALDNAKPSANGFWLIAPLPQWRQKKVRALIDWISKDLGLA
jgi:LysR family glycine cleavage system transcriptional activator